MSNGLAPFLMIWTLAALLISTAFGQTRDAARQVVDVVHFKNQKPIRGLILDESPSSGLVVAVSKKWLERENPEAYAKALAAAEKEASKARLQFRDRLRSIAETKTGAIGFVVSRELDRIEKEIEAPPQDEYQFFALPFKSSIVTNRNGASTPNRKLAVWSWHEGLMDVETRSPSSLQEELKSKGIDIRLIPPSLADRFYPREESDDQWRVRMAIVSHRLDKPIEFQGSGDVMLAVGGEQRPDVAILMGRMMQSQMNTLLQELANGGKSATKNQGSTHWIKEAIAQAEKLDALYFRATQVKMDSLQGIADVESVFMSKLENGDWAVTWKAAMAQKSSDQKQEEVDRIRDDPQFKEIQKHLDQFGGTSSSLDTAIRMGAATKSAQSLVDQEFQQFSERYLKRLNAPPVTVRTK